MPDIFAVVADRTRREILRVLHERERQGEQEASVSQIVAELGLSQPTVSKHLKVLRESSLVVVRDEGQHRFYRLDPAPLEELASWLEPLRPQAGAEGAEAASQASAPAEGAVAAESGDPGSGEGSADSAAPDAHARERAGAEGPVLGTRARGLAGVLGRSLAGARYRVGGAARRVWPAERDGR